MPTADTPLAAANLAIKFALELASLAAFAYWGANAGHGVVAVLLAIAAPVLMVIVWGRLAAPRSEHRLPLSSRIPLELAVFTLAALALLEYSTVAVVAFAAVVIINALLLTALRQWQA